MSSASKTPPGATGREGDTKLRVSAEFASRPRFGGVLCFGYSVNLGAEKIARSAIRAPIPAGITEDVTFLAIRYHGMRPILGYRDGRTFHLLFIDHSFSVYDHS